MWLQLFFAVGVIVGCFVTGTVVQGGKANYDEERARLALLLSSAAYADIDSVKVWNFANPSCSALAPTSILPFFVADNTAFGYVALLETEQLVVIAFKGTENIHDWVTDASSWPTHYDQNCTISPHNRASSSANLGRVHHGFCEYYQSLAAEGLVDAAAQLARKHPTFSFLVTGHSLGGATASLAAVDLHERLHIHPDKISLYSFGAPRAGDHLFARRLGASTAGAFRIVHSHDIVPHLAPCCHESLLSSDCLQDDACPYHGGQQVWYDNDMAPGDSFVLCGESNKSESGEPSCNVGINLSIPVSST
jgi:hypothetical protein